ncbi:Serine/threonine-protein kinase tel-1 [Purpureocillium lavendulum]|uniref:Serine/threonine-protein kinase Tel1 n=1 Tax=Purpureocillium lavendulum TaxID=1247861 RepID=A0AB34G175_9HYPO|nr:Serine/threonine-protein kinase tel-1 [Purpureocillium lavendulum]
MASSNRSTVGNVARDIKTGSIRDREKAVDDLIHLLKAKAPNLAALEDRGYHDLFEALFSLVLVEKPVYYDNRSNQSKRNGAASRLSKCASAVRLVASRGVSKFGRKTLLALIDHITQVLPGPNDDYVTPLLQDYVKALVEVLRRPCHVELLARKDGPAWISCVDFLLDVCVYILPREARSSVSALNRDSPAPGTPTLWSTGRSSGSNQSQKRANQADGKPLLDALEGLRCLVQAANAPVVQRAKDVTDLALRVLGLKNLSLDTTQSLCFAITNATFAAIQADDFQFSNSLVKSLLPLMSYWWRADKVSQDEAIKTLRNEISKTIFLAHLHIEYLTTRASDAAVRNDVENLVEPLWLEYAKRGEPFRLQLHDLTFDTSSLPEDSLRLPTFGLRYHNADGESHWALVQNLALLEATLLRIRRKANGAESDRLEQPQKRRRTQESSSRIRMKLKSRDGNEQRTALQLVPFLIAANVLEAAEVHDLLADLATCASSKHTTTASWALIACARKLILELFYPKIEELTALSDAWTKKASEGGNQISLERFQSLLSACVVGALLLPQVSDLNSVQSASVEPTVLGLVERSIGTALDSVEPLSFSDLILRLLRPCIPELSTAGLGRLHSENVGLLRLLVKVATALERQQLGPDVDHLDSMDVDDEFDSQSSRTTTASASLSMPRQNSQMHTSPTAFYADTRARLALLRVLSTDASQVGLVPDTWLDKLLSMSDEELLFCQRLLVDVSNSDLVMDQKNALKLVQRLGAIIGESEYQCCEVALTTCIDVINGLHRVWLNDSQDLSEGVGDLYNYFVKVCLPSNFFSPRAQMSMAHLLFTLLRVEPSYGTNLNLDSCRTTLLYILSNGTTKAKCYIADRIADVFELYILMLHDEVFVDVLDSLPANPEDSAGIAFRLLVLARLACRWPTLLRRCIYHIFETPGKIRQATEYAKWCLADIAKELNLESPKTLFALFSRQLLYTWMEGDSLQEVPYAIFGFQSLDELLRSAQAETMGLALMRGQETASADLARLIGSGEDDIIQRNFATTLSYSLIYGDAFGESGKPKGEDRIKKKLGNKLYAEAIHINFADTVALFFDLIDQEDSPERVFRRHPDLSYAADNLDEMKKIAHSPANLPPNQQPMFRAKYVIHGLFRLCQGTEFQFHDLWTPALVLSISRKLFSTIHPALGSLHACSVLRKVRLVMCLAGPVVLESYCLEMLLNSIRPFVVDSECADDALGMTRYLLQGGAQYLKQSPSFLAGYALSTLASLRVFLESSQSSTTQESQFKATMSKAQNFHEWFSNYLAEYSSPAFRGEAQATSFKSITQSAARIRSSGNADKDTFESNLLLGILRDSTSGDGLLNEPSRRLALGLLCSDFTIPQSIANDVVESDDQAIVHAEGVWKSCEAQDLSQDYLAWAGRVVGRSFAASGAIPDDTLRESRLCQYAKLSHGSNGSEEGLLRLLQDLTSSQDSIVAGMAEAALRGAVSQAVLQDDEPLVVACQRSLTEPLYLASQWGGYRMPPSEEPAPSGIEAQSVWKEDFGSPCWLTRLSVHLAESVPESLLLSVLPPILAKVDGFAEKAFPFVVHLVLYFLLEQQQAMKRQLSAAVKGWLTSTAPSSKDNVKLLINAILYLRTQEYPKESSIEDRLHWLEVDYSAAATAASRCGMYKTSLLFAELISSDSTRASRRSSAAREADISDTLLSIFENIDDPDTYYGLPEEASLAKVLARVEYEKEGAKSLAFRGALYDSNIRLRRPDAEADAQALVGALGTLGLAGLSHSVLQTQQNNGASNGSIESTFSTARQLELWNLPAPPASEHHTVAVYKAFQCMHQATSLSAVRSVVYDGFSKIMKKLTEATVNATTVRSRLTALTALVELDDLLNVVDVNDMDKSLLKFRDRGQWMRSGRYDDVSQILSYRGTTTSMLSQHNLRLSNTKLPKASLRRFQVESMLLSSGVYRYHQATQESLNISTTLNKLIPLCEELGLHVDAAIKIEVANSLWDHGEMSTSIRMLQGIEADSSLNKQTIPVSRSDLLSKIGHKVSIARLEKPRDIQKTYLEPALKDLKRDATSGKEAGAVYHQFATFCDEQLQDVDGLEDLARLQNLKKGKSEEVADLKALISSTKDTQLRTRYSHVLNKEKQWLDLDEQELRRVEQTRSEFVRLSLENYLLSLAASDEYNNDALRFTALWLERSTEDVTNKAVQRHLASVPTTKFAALMNQLTSRLQNQDTPFQKLLLELVYNICVDHPYHGMYQIWSGTKARAQQKDGVAVLRVKATEKVAQRLAANKAVADIWLAIEKTSKYYHMLAMDRNTSKYKSGAKVALKDSTPALNLVNCLAKYRIPPPTMDIEVSANKDYSHVPCISKLEPTMTIASGVSAPKIITAVGSDGKRYKQLVKGGHDDLRQDAIMEQVFAAVSSLLKLHRSTQQRNLGIRTYKVLPLTATSGLIEFVPNTIPLHEFLMPAHERYFPKDLKGSQCRKEIFNVQSRTVETRISTYRKVTDKFHPVMRYFFMENFTDPDDWFTKRLAYTRSTAAISMLGHVLGLGDRHGHNILLDTKTGEAVHIDLGVAFEAGRILPVPELVPFRLTRDIIDGMGITKTEGVFRRCCEFTLDALREEQYSIMTILDVLRYDPLYTWTVSPLRLAKLQKARQDDDAGAAEEPDHSEADAKRGKKAAHFNEPSEADRALEVVRKKLSKTLSVTATVNDLINQATDERNLAVLYSVTRRLTALQNDRPFRPCHRDTAHFDDPVPGSDPGYPAASILPARSHPRREQRRSSTQLRSGGGACENEERNESTIDRGPESTARPMQAEPNNPSRRRPRLSSSSSSSAAAAKRPKFAADTQPSMASARARGKMPETAIDLTGSSSSSGPGLVQGQPRPAGSAFQPYSGAKKLVIKNLRAPSTSGAAQVEEYYARTARELHAAIQAILAGKRPAVPLERLYRGVEDMCRRGNASKTYSSLTSLVDHHLQDVVLLKVKRAGAASDLDMLRSILGEWKTWNAQAVTLRSTFSYLDRTYLLRESLPSINDMTIAYFRRMGFFQPGVLPDRLPGQRAVAGICEMIEYDRRGDERMDSSLLKDAIRMLYVLGVYVKNFEPLFLKQSVAYFKEFGESWSGASLKEYIAACETLLQKEDYRFIAFNLESTTEKQLMDSAHNILIDQYSDKLLNGGSLAHLLSERDVKSMKGLYELLRLSGIQKKMKAPWGDYIRSTGASIISDKERGDDMVLRLLELRRSLDLMIRDAFDKDEVFLWGMREAFGKFMNDRTIAACWSSGTSKIGEMTAKYIDLLLRGGLKALPKDLYSDVKDRAAAEKLGHASSADEDAELDRQLDQALELFRFIEGKDAFEAFYKKDLARRLLMGRSASQDAERNMLTKLRGECGSNFTHNLEQMFKDQELAKDEMESYRQWMDASAERKKRVDLSVMILSAAAWPTYPDVRLNLPDEVATEIERFDGHYKFKHTGRILTWKHSLAHCSIKASFPKGNKELLVSAFQAVVLMLFNDVSEDQICLTYDEISTATGLQGGDLDRTLQSLACGKARVLSKHPKGRDVKATDTFTFNDGFTDPKYRVKINQIQLKETKEENKATHERIAQDRRFETQAAIVRIMKSRKSMGHAELVAEVINLTKKRGSVEPAAIKKEIESLIEKDYIEREDNAYTYLA